MIANYKMVVDFARPNKSNTVLVAENDANSRSCDFTLLFDKAPFDMENVTVATIMALLPGGGRVYDEAIIKQDDEGNNINELTWTIPLSITEASGNVTLTVTLADSLGARITSFEFYIKVRNQLYNEDDFIDDDDLQGFRDLLARARAALERMETMVEQDALPNPYPIRITVDEVEYEYNGEDLVEIFMGKVAYWGEPSGLVEVTEDDSAAARAVAAAESAAQSLSDCEDKYEEISEIVNNFEGQIPTATVEKDYTRHVSTIIITDKNGVTTAEVVDGVIGNSWYIGTAIIGGQGTTGATGAAGLEGDFYLNTNTQNVYRCTFSGDATTALWDYLLTMESGGGGTTYDAGTGISLANNIISVDFQSIASGGEKPVTSGDIYTALSAKANSSDLDEWTEVAHATTNQGITSVVFDNLNDSYGYVLFADTDTEVSYKSFTKSPGTNSGIKLTYILNPTGITVGSTGTDFQLRIYK